MIRANPVETIDAAREQVRIRPVILTTPARRGEHVDTIAAAFAGHPAFTEPIIHCDDNLQGAALATRDALRRAAGAGPVLFLEDDLLVDEEAGDRIAATRFPPDVAIVSFCDMREVPEFSREGLYPRSALGSDGLGWWGNQALLIHEDTVTMLQNVDWFSDDVESSHGVLVHKATYLDEGRNCSDIRMSLLVRSHGGRRVLYAVSVPSLFKHVGYESLCFPGRGMGERETRNWIGSRQEFGINPR